MKTQIFLMVVLLSTLFSIRLHGAQQLRIGMQSYTFHKFTLSDALDKTQALGVHFIEVYPGHRLGGKWGDCVFNFDMDSLTCKELNSFAQSKQVKIIAMGVITTQNANDWPKIFSFARMMGMEYITCEPELQHWNAIEELSKQYNIKVAVHNHPKPSLYWKPSLLLEQIKRRNKMIGSCADVGHWKREGLDPFECLAKLNNRVITLHLKDIAAPLASGGEAPDVIWGNGVLKIKELIELLKHQGFLGVLSIEYETNWENSVPDIRKCLEYFDDCLKK